jgi:hypothetical protein
VLGAAYGFYRGTPGLGYRVLNWIESGATSVAMLGDNGTTFMQSGLTAWIEN